MVLFFDISFLANCLLKLARQLVIVFNILCYLDFSSLVLSQRSEVLNFDLLKLLNILQSMFLGLLVILQPLHQYLIVKLQPF